MTKSAASIWADYEKEFGDQEEVSYYFPSGVTALNYLISDEGGIPGGSIVQLLGENGHGKTTLAYDLLASAQKKGMRDIIINKHPYNAMIVDIERSYDPDYAALLGVDVDKVFRIGPPQQKFAEESWDLAETALLQGIQFILVDSIGMLVAKDEEDKTYEDSEKMAVEAKALGRFVKRANAYMENDAIVILINHFRANLNKMGNAPDKKPYGARIVQYANKLTMELRRVKQEQDRDFIEVFIAKNKVGGRKGMKVSFEIVSTEGIDYKQHILDLALEYGIVEQRGAWYYYPSYENPTHRGQGKPDAKVKLPLLDVIKDEVEKFILSREEE